MKRWFVLNVLVTPLVWVNLYSERWAERLMDWAMGYKRERHEN